MKVWSARHPLGAYVLVTFAISWTLFVAGALGAELDWSSPRKDGSAST